MTLLFREYIYHKHLKNLKISIFYFEEAWLNLQVITSKNDGTNAVQVVEHDGTEKCFERLVEFEIDVTSGADDGDIVWVWS